MILFIIFALLPIVVWYIFLLASGIYLYAADISKDRSEDTSFVEVLFLFPFMVSFYFLGIFIIVGWKILVMIGKSFKKMYNYIQADWRAYKIKAQENNSLGKLGKLLK